MAQSSKVKSGSDVKGKVESGACAVRVYVPKSVNIIQMSYKLYESF